LKPGVLRQSEYLIKGSDSVQIPFFCIPPAERDLVITNSYIYDPIVKNEESGCKAVFLEDYGTSEPTDALYPADIC